MTIFDLALFPALVIFGISTIRDIRRHNAEQRRFVQQRIDDIRARKRQTRTREQ